MAEFISTSRLQEALHQSTRRLIGLLGADGHWAGHLSSSALSTATAVTALSLVNREIQDPEYEVRIQRGLTWLAEHANVDGGWGDTTLSLSNISTTTLCWAAFGVVPNAELTHAAVVGRAEQWLADKTGIASFDDPESGRALARAIIARYGKDRTFSVPILTMCALAGRLGTGREAWRHVIPLPFELAACPRNWFATLRLPVVSYALPALIAIGQARYHHAPPWNPITRTLRSMVRSRTLDVLQSIQPPNGGFLEATPLTSFVTMSLASIGKTYHAVTQKGVSFLLASQDPDGSWPIDTNLATWVTTLSIDALSPHDHSLHLTQAQRLTLREWLLGQQYLQRHAYTNAAPGGWAWTNLPGGVPDADDTAGALLALRHLADPDAKTIEAARLGITWLISLQNRDGGIPTFCRGWGNLPFDRSSADITAHAIRAWLAWRSQMPPSLQPLLTNALDKALAFLAGAQRDDGAWVPLWFGNQFDQHDQNPTYGTTRVIAALSSVLQEESLLSEKVRTMRTKAITWLGHMQKEDGSWSGAAGAPSSVEETALAVEALAGVESLSEEQAAALQRGAQWLVENVESGQWTNPAPIGFYFAKLWYFEDLYPVIFTVAALQKLAAQKAIP